MSYGILFRSKVWEKRVCVGLMGRGKNGEEKAEKQSEEKRGKQISVEIEI